MANRTFRPLLGTLAQDVVMLYANLVVGASGAVTTGTGAGVTSITKESTAGQYTVLLSDAYQSLLSASIMLLDTTDSDPATVAISARVKSEAVATTGAVVIQAIAMDDGAAANFRDGARVLLCFHLKNSTVS